MTKQSDAEPTITHTDAYSQDLGKPVSTTVQLTVATGEEETGVTSENTDVAVNYPVDDSEELGHTAHLIAQLAAHNRTVDGGVHDE